jgi:hypothetical protein
MNLAAFLLIAAFAEPAAARQPAGAGEAPKKERMICRRFDASESRMASKRVCKTAKQWKKEQSGDGEYRDMATDTRTSQD